MTLCESKTRVKFEVFLVKRYFENKRKQTNNFDIFSFEDFETIHLFHICLYISK